MGYKVNVSKSTMKNESKLQRVITDCLDVSDYEVQDMSAWTRNPNHPPAIQEHVRIFREELENALRNSGTVTPADFERWTRVEVESQADVQRRLQEIWNVCFGPRDGGED
jgi:hypothetical protein